MSEQCSWLCVYDLFDITPGLLFFPSCTISGAKPVWPKRAIGIGTRMAAPGESPLLDVSACGSFLPSFPWWWKHSISLPCSIGTTYWLLSGILKKLSNFLKNLWHLNKKNQKNIYLLIWVHKRKKKNRSGDPVNFSIKLQNMLERKFHLKGAVVLRSDGFSCTAITAALNRLEWCRAVWVTVLLFN